MNTDDHLVAFKYYLAQFNGAKTDEARAAWALLIANELSKIIDTTVAIEPMLALHSAGEGK